MVNVVKYNADDCKVVSYFNVCVKDQEEVV